MLALAAGKSAARATRLVGRGGGTAITGMVARKVDPRILDELVRVPGVPVVAITGSNGKTTTARFTAALLRGEGITVCHNSAGANLMQGVTSLAVSYASLRGRLPDGVLVAEVDEGALPQVAPETLPRALLVTDLFRDQLDRFGEIYAVRDAIESVAAALPEDAALVVNADDPMVATMAEKRDGRRVTFGSSSSDPPTRSPAPPTRSAARAARADLKYRTSTSRTWATTAARPAASPGPSWTSRSPRWRSSGSIERAARSRRRPAGSPRDPAVGRAHRLRRRRRDRHPGRARHPLDHAAESLASVGPAFGRLEKIDADGKTIILAFAKNPTSLQHHAPGAGHRRRAAPAADRRLQHAGRRRGLRLAVGRRLRVDGSQGGAGRRHGHARRRAGQPAPLRRRACRADEGRRGSPAA
jgi:hypothetical protein